MRCLALLVFTALSPALAVCATPEYPSLADLAIKVTPEHPREFIFSDKGAAHLAGEAVGENTRSYHGFYVAMHELMDGWSLRLEDGSIIDPDSAFESEVRPDRLRRRHRAPDGSVVTETVTLFDRANGFRVVYEGVPSGGFAILPRVDMRFLWRVGKPSYEVRWQEGILLIARQDALDSPPDPAHPAWLAIAVAGATGFASDYRHLDLDYPKGRARQAMDHTSPYLPGAISGRIPPRIPSGRVEMICAAAETAEKALARARELRRNAFDLTLAREQRLDELVASSAITTGNERDDRALAWARLSMDTLIMDQRGPGIYAGYYWFTTYWGRDTFISLPGACIVNGDFDAARTLLRSFSQFQELDPNEARFGRVPNFVTVDQVQYASIDGTWWFVRAVDELWLRTGDEVFAREMAPVVLRAVEGAMKHAVDEAGFLTHGHGETWMDGGGEDHPYSPRGNRAVEAQALWHRGLLVASRLAELVDNPEYAARYRARADALADRFHEEFWAKGRLVDHLNEDGSPDEQVRPNGLLAVMSSPSLFTLEQRELITREAGADLVKPWGVISLAADDPFFHPRHLDLENYYYDEAYHNGDVWLWLSGAYVSALNDAREGFGQTRMLLDEILDEGAVGTLQEIRDGARAESNDEFGGATSQAWSLAELLRNVVEDYLGLQADLTADPPLIRVRPQVPDAWPALSVRTRLGDHDCLFRIKDGQVELEADPPLPQQWRVDLGGED
jgi:glycogen debranching enzyme